MANNRSPDVERLPGRSFEDPSQPLGEEVIKRGDPFGGGAEEGVYGRAVEHAPIGHGVPERAKCVSVLRKAEELMASNNPPGDTDASRRRAIELACGRCGVTVKEYDLIVANDEELQALQANVMEAARLRTGGI